CLVGIILVYLVLETIEIRDTQREDYQRQIDSLALVARMTSGDEPLRRSLARLPIGAEGRAAVHLPAGRIIGNSRSSSAEIRRVADSQQAMTIDHDADITRLVPV